MELASECVGLLQDDKVKRFFFSPLVCHCTEVFCNHAHRTHKNVPQACKSQYVIQFFSQSAIITIQPPGQS